MRRILGIALVVALWLALFEVPSAVAIGRGAPWWLAAAIGGGCVVVLFGMHLWRERQRTTKSAKTTLTGWDRLVLRTVAVALVAGAGAWFLAKPSLLPALRHHGLWMIPRSTSGLVADSRLLEQVPASADAVLWVRSRSSAALGEYFSAVSQLAEIPAERYELVGAVGKSDALLVVDASRDVTDAFESLMSKVRLWTGLPDPIASDVGSARQWTTAGWQHEVGKGPPVKLFALFDRAPTDADVVFAMHPAKPAGKDPVSMLAWLRVDGDVLEAAVEMDTASVTVAADTIDQARREFERKVSHCADRDMVHMHQAGTAVRFEVRLEREATLEMLRCLDSHP